MINKLDKLLLQHFIKARLKEIEKIIKNNQQQSKHEARIIDKETKNTSHNESMPVDETMISNLTHHKNELMKNLVWLDSEDAGQCECCGAEISWKRLNEFLETRLCTTCVGRSTTIIN